MCSHKMRRTVEFLLLLILHIMNHTRLSKCEICNKQTIRYKIDEVATILDISSEDISQLRAPCVKILAIPDALFGTIRVDEAKFSGNKGFLVEATGMVQKTFSDTAFISNTCEQNPQRTGWSREITEGLEIFNITDVICITFKPELNHRSLGYHVQGDKIRLSLKVNFAYCNHKNTSALRSMPTRVRREACRPICSFNGIVSPCVGTTTQFRQRTTTRSIQTSLAAPIPSKSSKIPMTYPNFVPFVHRNTIAPFSRANATTMDGPNTQTTGHSQESSSEASQNTPVENIVLTTKRLIIANKSNEKFQIGVHTLSKITKITPTSRSIMDSNKQTTEGSIFQTSNIYDGESTNKDNELSGETFGALTTQGSSIHYQLDPSSTRTDRGPVDGNSSKTFGLIEGLYVLVGCLVVFVVIFAFIYCVRVRNKSRSGLPPGNEKARQHRPALVSDSSYMSRWRDNWLIRYHNTEKEGDDPSVFENNIDQIRDSTLSNPNQDLHNTHAYLMKENSQSVMYHDPWPLIRLDSDFVRNTKSLERVSSNKKTDICSRSTIKHILTQNVSKASSDSGIGGKESVASCNYRVKNKTQSLKDKPDSSKESFRYIRRVNSHLRSRGSYNVSKAHRSVSLTKHDSCRGHFEGPGKVDGKYKSKGPKHCKQEDNCQELEIPDTQEDQRRGNRQRNTSSMCSESSLTFEEMIQKEIQKCDEKKAVFDDHNAEVNNTYGDGSKCYGTETAITDTDVDTGNEKAIRDKTLDETTTSAKEVYSIAFLSPNKSKYCCRSKDASVNEDSVSEKSSDKAKNVKRCTAATETSYETSANQEEYIHDEKRITGNKKHGNESEPVLKRKPNGNTDVNTSIPPDAIVSQDKNDRLRQQKKSFSAIGTLQFPK